MAPPVRIEMVEDMKFGGLQKLSMIDFPGHIAAVVFTAGCNYACPYCHNPSLLALDGSAGIDASMVLEFLEKRKKVLDGVAVTGGEPTLSPGLPAFLTKVREMGYRIKLDTNGSRPDVLEELLAKGLVDYVAMDIKTLPELYPTLVKAPADIEKRLRKSIRIVMESDVVYEFRTTCVKAFLTDEIVERIGRIIEGASLWSFQQCRPDNVLKPDFFTGKDALFEADDLVRFSRIAAGYVRKSLVR